jgi:hypothetical protein
MTSKGKKKQSLPAVKQEPSQVGPQDIPNNGSDLEKYAGKGLPELAGGKIFEFLDLRPDDYSDLVLTSEEATKIQQHIQHLSTGSTAALPIICGGNAHCPWSGRCPYLRLDKERKAIDIEAKSITPIGRQCPLEAGLLHEWTKFYIQEYKINPTNFTEFQMTRELAEIELMLWRLNNNLNKPENAELVQETVIGVDKQGNVLSRKEISALFEAKERLQNRKSRLVKLMVGDRQEKYKREAALKQHTDSDPSISAAKMRASIDRLIHQAKNLDIKLKEAEGSVLDAEFTESSENANLTPEDMINLPPKE